MSDPNASSFYFETHGFFPVLTPVEYVGPHGIEVAPRYFFQPAADDQIAAIKSMLQAATDMMGEMWVSLPYETRFRPATDAEKAAHKASFNGVHEPMPRAEWRYWILQHEGTNWDSANLDLACSLSPNEIFLGPYFMKPNKNQEQWARMHSAVRIAIFSQFITELKPVSLQESDLREIRQIHDALSSFPSDYPQISRALMLYDQADSLPRMSEMRTIGLFAVMEALVLHDPKGSHDSLLHQLRTKMPFLSKRFTVPLDAAAYFDTLGDKKLWNALYEYRSLIVHGGAISFAVGQLSPLKGVENVQRFLREFAKRLLLLALADPELVSDLQNC